MIVNIYDIEFTKTTRMLKIPLMMNKRYADNVNAVAKKLGRRMEVKIREGRVILEEGQEDTVLEDDAHTAAIYRAIANTIRPRSIVMEEDVASRHPGGRLPILDMETWVEGGELMIQFYRTPMASRPVVMARSAFTTRSTRSMNILNAQFLQIHYLCF